MVIHLFVVFITLCTFQFLFLSLEIKISNKYLKEEKKKNNHFRKTVIENGGCEKYIYYYIVLWEKD